jgi:dihydroorotate dehydrogenase
MPPEQAHYFALELIAAAKKFHLLPIVNKNTSPVKIANIIFPNPIGLAAGLDKNADFVEPLSQLGFGFIEVGTVTPKPQTGNPLPRLFRLPKDNAIINRMGFNNNGLDHLVAQLKKLQNKDIIIGANFGKNRDTPLDNAIEDYLQCLKALYSLASYLVVNISSPNTPGLRDLQNEAFLKQLLMALTEQAKKEQDKLGKKTPLFVKIAPDLTEEEIKNIAQQLTDFQIDGVIATNTTIQRPDFLKEKYQEENGGLSGKPLKDLSTRVIKILRQELGPTFPIIGVGGIFSPADAAEKIAAGANLVQIYSGLIYEGPQLVSRLLISKK